MDFITGQNTPYFSWGFDFKICDSGPVKLPGLSRNGPLFRNWEENNQRFRKKLNSRKSKQYHQRNLQMGWVFKHHHA